MRIPTVHLNGTDKTTLLAELEAALTALHAAQQALLQITVHGRDYYPQGDFACNQAREEMNRRAYMLQTVAQELTDLYMAIDAQGKN